MMCELCSIKDFIVHWVLPLLCLFRLRNFETIQYVLCHRIFSYMINQKFMTLCTLQDPNMKMCTLVGYPGPSSLPRIMSLKVVFQICFGSITMMGMQGVLVPRSGQLSYSIYVSMRDSCVQQYLRSSINPPSMFCFLFASLQSMCRSAFVSLKICLVWVSGFGGKDFNVISHEWGKDRKVFMTSGTYPIYHQFCNDGCH